MRRQADYYNTPPPQYSKTPILQCSVGCSLLLFHQPAVASDDDKPARMFASVPGPITLGQQAPRRSELLPAPAAFGLARAATVGMVNRIARDAPVDQPNAPVAR